MSEAHPLSPRANKVADWMELVALREARPLGEARMRELAVGQRLTDADLALGRSTIRRRQALLGGAHPFVVGAGLAATPGAPVTAWTTMLLMSATSPLRGALNLPAAANHFEQITVQALESLYGPGTKALRFGWPSEIGRPQEFPDAVRWLADQMSVPVGHGYRPPYRKDGGVDAIAWRPFPDGRSGFPVTLVQCTLERDYQHKASDVDVRVWASWLRLDVDPATALAVPEVVPSGERWNQLAARTVVLDRIRLAALIGEADVQPRLAGVHAWTGEALQALRSSR